MNNSALFKQTLRKKWLDYYRVNQEWLIIFLDKNNEWSKCSNGRRPPAYVILGALTALDQNLVDWMEFFCTLQPDAATIVRALDLDFDPDIELKKMDEQELSNVAVSEPDPDFYAEYEEVGKHLDEIRQSMNEEEKSS